MTGYSTGRRLRKSQRQVRNAFVARPCRFHRWRWYDWAFAFLTVALLIYALVSLITASVAIAHYRTHRAPSGNADGELLSEEIKRNYEYSVGLPLAISLLVAEIFLIVLMVLVFFWLRYYRNVGCWLILAVLIILAIVFFLTIGGVATDKTANDKAVREYAFNYVTRKLGDTIQSFHYDVKMQVLYTKFQCCGINGYRDYVKWNAMMEWPHDPKSVPIQCCKAHKSKAELESRRDECKNMEIFEGKPSSARLQEINTKGCGEAIRRLIWEGKALLVYILHGFIIGILLFIYFLLFLALLWTLRGGRGHGKWVDFKDPHEQEDLAESDIVPGTPAKSMMSDSENTFYAP